MTTSALLAPIVTALALLCFPSPALIRSAAEPADRWAGATFSPRWRRAAVTCASVSALVVLFGLWPWWIGLLLGAVGGALTLRLPRRRRSADREGDRHRLAVHADLLAACLDAGMSVGSSLVALSPSRTTPSRTTPSRTTPSRTTLRTPPPSHPPTDPDDPLALLDAVAALLLLGADPERAWQGAQRHSDLASLAGAARRSAAGGAAFAEAVREHAVVLRAAAANAAERSAGRAGVAITAPLGLCFLPAFLCLGLAPVVVGLLSSLHLF